MSKQPPPAPTASAVGPCPTVIKIVGRPGTGSLPSTFAPPDHPTGDGISDERFNRKTGEAEIGPAIPELVWSGKSDLRSLEREIRPAISGAGSAIWFGPAILERKNGPAIPGLVYQPSDRRSDNSHTNPEITVTGNRTCDILIQGSQVRFPAYPSRDRMSDFQYQSRDRRSDFPLMLAPFRAQSPLHKIEKTFFWNWLLPVVVRLLPLSICPSLVMYRGLSL